VYYHNLSYEKYAVILRGVGDYLRLADEYSRKIVVTSSVYIPSCFSYVVSGFKLFSNERGKL
jgi:hypothetical protein